MRPRRSRYGNSGEAHTSLGKSGHRRSRFRLRSCIASIMPSTKCGFNDQPGGLTAVTALVKWGPTLLVDIGFDPNYKNAVGGSLPVPGKTGLYALVDTGATESCIDRLLAAQLNL